MTTDTRPAEVRRLFHALSDETRLRIVELLSGGEQCVCELQDHLDAAQSRLSYHLKILKEAGVVSARCEGRWCYYSLVPGAFEQMRMFVRAVQPPAPSWRG